MATWRDKREHPLSRDALRALLENEIPAIRIRDFATADECASFAAAMRGGNIRSYGVDREIGYIGMAQYEFRWGKDKRDYFAAVPKAFADQRAVFARSFDPMTRFIDTLQGVWPAPIGLAQDEYGPYFAGIIRFATGGIDLHADYAPFNMPGYAVADITSQLAWNLFVEAPATGGVTTVHHSPWTPAMRDDTPPKSYGLPREDVAGAETFDYCAVAGDVVIFNSRNQHEVSPGGGGDARGRLQIGSFVGRQRDDALVLFA